LKILIDNLPAIFIKEIEKLAKCIEDMQRDLGFLNNKLLLLVEKLDNSLQQYELVFHEAELCKEELSTLIKQHISDKIILEILRIKNPNETLYEVMKMFFIILNEANNENNKTNNFSWIFLQSTFSPNKNKNFTQGLTSLLEKEIPKEVIDLSMPFTLNYNEIKNSITKINKNLVYILDFIKLVTDSNIKRNIVKSLYVSNMNKHTKMTSLKDENESKRILGSETEQCLVMMQNDLKILLMNVMLF
jgi:hypothetical protein